MRRDRRPDAALADALSALREQRGLSLEGLAFRSGITPGTLAGIELAELAPQWGTVRMLARGLGTTLADLGAAVEAREHRATHGLGGQPIA